MSRVPRAHVTRRACGLPSCALSSAVYGSNLCGRVPGVTVESRLRTAGIGLGLTACDGQGKDWGLFGAMPCRGPTGNDFARVEWCRMGWGVAVGLCRVMNAFRLQIQDGCPH